MYSGVCVCVCVCVYVCVCVRVRVCTLSSKARQVPEEERKHDL